jgi:8-oxo-dGTP pyrophosphatase MutT (NUDIX family)
MEYKVNTFGDICILFDKDKELPKDIDYECKHHVIISQAPSDFSFTRLSHLIGTTKEHGYIFGNGYAKLNFPVIKDGILQGGCTVILGEHKHQTYAVLVQVKKRPFVMNPAGYLATVDDNCLKAAALREAFEETGLKLNADSWQKLADWKFNATFAGLGFAAYTLCGIAELTTWPIDWQSKMDNQVAVSVVHVADNEETDSIVIFNLSFISTIDELNKNQMFPSKLDGHHFNVMLAAAVKKGAVEKSMFAQLERPVPYLKDFHYF